MHQMRLGELIAALESCSPDRDVRFDFGGLRPDAIDSYRGYYEDLAIGFREGFRTVGGLLAALRSCVGHTFEGYKGGEFRMDAGTRLWAANHGRCHDTAIVGVCGTYDTVLATAYYERD